MLQLKIAFAWWVFLFVCSFCSSIILLTHFQFAMNYCPKIFFINAVIKGHVMHPKFDFYFPSEVFCSISLYYISFWIFFPPDLFL